MMTIRLGMMTPSSNTVLEPITTAMLAGVSGVTAHFSRFARQG
jgi:maleate isomerase